MRIYEMNRSVEKKVRKQKLTSAKRIACGFCPYHRSENKSSESRRSSRCWKSQYRTRRGLITQARDHPKNIHGGFYINPNDSIRLAITHSYDWTYHSFIP